MDSMDEKVMEAVHTLVKAKVAKALDEDNKIIETIVNDVLREGRGYDRHGKEKSMLQVILEDRVKLAVKKEIDSCLESKLDAIKETINEQATPIMDRLVGQVVSGIKRDDWRVDFRIRFNDEM